jgi:hypothetical protein
LARGGPKGVAHGEERIGLNDTVARQRSKNWSSVGHGSRWSGVGWLAGFTAKRRARQSEPRRLHHAGMTVRVWRPWWQRREGRSALGSPLLGRMGSTRSGRCAHWGHVRTCASGAGVACTNNSRLANSGAGAGHGRDVEQTWAAAASPRATWVEGSGAARACDWLRPAMAKPSGPGLPSPTAWLGARHRVARGGDRARRGRKPRQGFVHEI